MHAHRATDNQLNYDVRLKQKCARTGEVSLRARGEHIAMKPSTNAFSRSLAFSLFIYQRFKVARHYSVKVRIERFAEVDRSPKP